MSLGGLPSWLSGRESTCQCRTLRRPDDLWSGRSPGEGKSNPLQYSCLGNPMDEEPGGLQPMRLKRIRHELANKQQHVSENLCHLASDDSQTHMSQKMFCRTAVPHFQLSLGQCHLNTLYGSYRNSPDKPNLQGRRSRNTYHLLCN